MSTIQQEREEVYAASVLARVLPCRVTSFVVTQAGGLSMAARGSPVRRRERRMRSWWRHEQASVRMALITAGPLFHDFDLESDDTDPNDLDALAPVTEYVAPAPVVACNAPVPVIEYTTPGPDVTFSALAPVVEYVL